MAKELNEDEVHQKPLTLFMEPEAKAQIMKLFEYAVMSYGSTYEQLVGFGADIEAEKNRSQRRDTCKPGSRQVTRGEDPVEDSDNYDEDDMPC